ncbi:MAG TPA: hypothetical protein VFW71_16555 [Actinomycetota bacterium]|nr:hypothetical protein [Actinomycetota bacterium]
MSDALRDVMLGWLLNWCNCPDKGLHGAERARVEEARRAAGEGASALFGATRQDLERALDDALAEFPDLCPDVPEERRLRMAARLARVLEGDRLRHLLGGPVYTAPPARSRRTLWTEDVEAVPEQADLEEEDLEEDGELEAEAMPAEDLDEVAADVGFDAPSAEPAGDIRPAEPEQPIEQTEPSVAPAGNLPPPGPPRHLATDDTSWGPLWGPDPEASPQEEYSPGPRPDAAPDIG